MIPFKSYKASEEVANFIALTDPAKVLAFRPSEETTQRVLELVEREKSAGITSEERQELDYYMHLEHLMRMAKIFAQKYSSKK